jgi:hypothetical protein
MTNRKDVFNQHYETLFMSANYEGRESLVSILTDECTETTLHYHIRCLEILLEEWIKGKFQDQLVALLRKEIAENKELLENKTI